MSWPGYDERRPCTCTPDTYFEPGSICEHCEAAAEQREADEEAIAIAEAHLRDPEPEDFQEAPPC